MTTRPVTRRRFVATVGGSLVAVSVPRGFARAIGRRSSRPNILLIMSDEHNASVTGCYGSPYVRTRSLDQLAERGVVFENFYCNSPLCVPSRMAFTAGKYISRTGAWSNSCWLPSDDYPSIARVLQSLGYETFLCGKMHYDATRRYGFTEIGGNMNNNFKTGRGGRRKPDDLKPSGKLSSRFNDFHVGETSSVIKHDLAVTKGTVEFLQKRRRSDGPFFLVAGYLAPHFPLIVPKRYWEQYAGRIPMPVIPPGHLDELPLNYKHLRVAFQVVGVPDEIVRLGRELYHGLTHWLDDQIDIVLRTLAGSDVADNTIVIYTTDHGENMGEHGMWWKNCMFEHAARIPLIISWPDRWSGGQRRRGACSMVDLVQTIIELAGGQAPDDWDGDSMLSWLDDANYKWKDFAVSEYYGHFIASGYAMLRTGRYKYVYHARMDENHGPERELYDLETDPGEFNNLASNPQYQPLIEKLHKQLVAELGEEPDETELRCRADYAKGYNRRQPAKTKSTAKKQQSRQAK